MAAELDEIIHQPIRLKLMSALYALPEGEGLEFQRLKVIAGATGGNLGSHLMTLERAGYVENRKEFVGRRPRTRLIITRAGRRAFAGYLDYIRDVIAGH